MVVAVCGRGERGWILKAARASLSRKIEENWPGLGEQSPIKGAGGPRAAAVALGCGAVIRNSLFRPTVEKDMEEVSVSKGTNHLVESNGPKDLAVAFGCGGMTETPSSLHFGRVSRLQRPIYENMGVMTGT